MKPSGRIFILTLEGYPAKGGAATVCQELCRAAVKLGWDARLCCPGHPGLATLDGIPVLPLKIGRDRGFLNQRRTRRAWKTHVFPQINNDDILHIGEAAALETWMRFQNKPAFSRIKASLVLTLHGSEILRLTRTLWQRHGFARLLRRVNRIHVLSPFVHDMLTARFPDLESRILYVHGAPRPLRNRQGLRASSVLPEFSPEKQHIVSLGRIHPRKGQDYLLKAAAALPPDLQARTEIWFFGPIRKDRYFQSCAKLAANQNTRVHFIHGASDSVIEAAMKHACLTTLTSRNTGSSVEGLGLALLEAARYSVPAIVHDSGGIRYAVDPGKSALVVPEGDTRALTAALVRLLSDPALLREMGRAAEHFTAAFSWEGAARRLYTLA